MVYTEFYLHSDLHISCLLLVCVSSMSQNSFLYIVFRQKHDVWSFLCTLSYIFIVKNTFDTKMSTIVQHNVQMFHVFGTHFYGMRDLVARR